MKILLHLATVFSFFVLNAATAFAQDGAACGCNDIGQIWVRSLEAAAAVKSLETSLKFNENLPPPFYDERRSINAPLDWPRVNYLLETAINSVFAELDKSVGSGAEFESKGEQAVTGYQVVLGKCGTQLPKSVRETATACQLAWIDAHEAVHRKSCGKDGISWHSTVRSKIQDEIDAYSAESVWLEAQQQRLLCSCAYYSVRLEMERPLPKTLTGQPVRLFNVPNGSQAEKPFVDISLQPKPQSKLQGDGSAMWKADMQYNERGAHGWAKGTSPLDLHILADSSIRNKVHTTIHMILKDGTFAEVEVTDAGVTLHGEAKIVGNKIIPSGQTIQKPEPAFELDFSSFDKLEFKCPREFRNASCHATLGVAEEYRTAKAANQKGLTVEEALWGIRAAAHTTLAWCH